MVEYVLYRLKPAVSVKYLLSFSPFSILSYKQMFPLQLIKLDTTALKYINISVWRSFSKIGYGIPCSHQPIQKHCLFMNKLFVLISLFLLFTTGVSRTVVTVFPLENRSDYTLTDWLAYTVPEQLYHTFLMDDAIQAWDPSFKSKFDHTAEIFHNDSLLQLHRHRWSWDIAIGGRYSVKGDSLLLVLTMVENRADTLSVNHNRYRGTVDGFFAFLDGIVFDLRTRLTQSPNLVTKTSSAQKHLSTYKTYAMGFGYEMRGEHVAAASAYLRALEMTPSFYRASLRLGNLYADAGRIEAGVAHLQKALSGSAADTVFTALSVGALAPRLPASQVTRIAQSKRGVLNATSAGLLALGKAYLQTGEYSRAVSALTRSVASGPGSPEAEFMLGFAYIKNRDHSTAIEIVNSLVKQFPDDPVYLSVLGTVYRSAERYMESSLVLEEVLQTDPENESALIELAHTWFRLGWYDKSARLLSRISDPDNSGRVLNNLGVIVWHAGREDSALTLFQHALEFPQTRQGALNNLGNVYYHSGNSRRALSYLKRAEKSAEVSLDILHNLGRVHTSRGNYKRALSYYQQVQTIAPRNMDILSEIALLYSLNGMYTEAARCYAQVMDVQPYNRDVLIELFNVLKKCNKCKDAVPYFEEYLFRLPFDMEIAVLMADNYRCMGWHEVAVVKYQEVIRRFPDHVNGYAGLAFCYVGMIEEGSFREVDRTIHTFLLAIERDQSDPRFHFEIGNLYMYHKQYRELAVDHWQKALELAPDRELRELITIKIGENR